jgi:hypothetical protein
MLFTVRALDGATVRAEQRVTDRKTMREVVVFMEEAVKERFVLGIEVSACK